MKNIFLDCGTHLCEGLKSFWNKKIIDNTFEIHTFEPNPACFVEERIKSLPFNLTFHNCAVWTEDGEILFNQENHKKSGSRSPNDNKSDVDGWASAVSGTGFSFLGHEQPIKVKSIDFSKFVDQLPKDSRVICKMDIEGSEFEVLKKMILDETIKRFESIYVEFHERYMPAEFRKTKIEIVSKITDMGVKLYPWA